jgi:hypothetical protein
MQIALIYQSVYEYFKYSKVGFLQKKVYFNQIFRYRFTVGLNQPI